MMLRGGIVGRAALRGDHNSAAPRYRQGRLARRKAAPVRVPRRPGADPGPDLRAYGFDEGCLLPPFRLAVPKFRMALLDWYEQRRALRGRSHRARPSLVRHADFREHGGFEAMASLLADADLDAVFVANNLMTVGALECLVQQGVQVPREMGVVGFDEIPWATLVRPSLSTVAQPSYEMGKTAGELLTTRPHRARPVGRDHRAAHDS